MSIEPIEVFRVPFKFAPQTGVWLSGATIDDLDTFRQRKRVEFIRFWKKLVWCARIGFSNAEIARVVRSEGKGVFRFGIQDSLFRILGFYELDRKIAFIGTHSYEKRGQDLGEEGRRLVAIVAEVKRDGKWFKGKGFPGSFE
jgi:hypothetical protein